MKKFFEFNQTTALVYLVILYIGLLLGLVYGIRLIILNATVLVEKNKTKEFVFYPRTITPTNKYSNKRYESILDSLKHDNDSLRNELRLYIDGCDHKEQIYEQIIHELEHNRTKKSHTLGTKDSL